MAAVADAGAIAPLLAELGHPLDVAMLRTRLAELAHLAPSYASFVAEIDGAIVGVVSAYATPVLHRVEPVGRISVLVVRANLIGGGTGTVLLRRAEDFLHALGCKRIEVTSAEHRTAAHQFYLHRGYRLQGVRFAKEIDAQSPEDS